MIGNTNAEGILVADVVLGMDYLLSLKAIFMFCKKKQKLLLGPEF